jgi:small-conductance mechanosensitive channel
MKETLKNFCAMVIATTIWVLGLLIILSGYYLFESGPVIEEVIFLLVVIGLFVGGLFLARKNKRIETALQLPLFP